MRESWGEERGIIEGNAPNVPDRPCGLPPVVSTPAIPVFSCRAETAVDVATLRTAAGHRNERPDVLRAGELVLVLRAPAAGMRSSK